MSCHICGNEPAKFRVSKLQTLCDDCNKETPRKVSREAFDKRYWGAEKVPEGIKKEFYSDYLASTDTLEQYIEKTVTKVEE